MKASDLKASILQLAVSGKLVLQDPNDEPAGALLKRIKKEREALLKAGKIKKGKPLAEISEDEVPFEIPASWEWVRLGDIGTTNIGLTYKPTDISPTGFPVLRSNNIQNGKIDYNDMVHVNIPLNESKLTQKDDILICARNGSKNLVGKAALIESNEMSFGAFMAIYRSPYNAYIYRFLNSPCFRTQLGDANTTTINQITQDMLRKIICPLPPLAEQQRIVARIEELMPLVEAYDHEEQKLSALEAAFPEALRQSILQYAVEGKLVLQKAEDGTAAELLAKIRKEREALVKEGKIKRGKPLSPVSEEEKPFEIPASWEWVRLGDVTHNFGQKKPETQFTYIDVGSIDNKNGCLGSNLQVILPKDAPSRARKIVKKGTVIYSTVRPYLLNICIIESEPEKEFIASTAFCILAPFSGFLNTYLYYCLRSPVFTEYVSNEMMGMAYPAISDKELLAGLIPLPPLAEQQRIVERVQELMGLCDRIPKKVK